MFRALAVMIALVVPGLSVCATEINIGVNNTVNTGTVNVNGGNCFEGDGVTKNEDRSLPSFQNISVDGIFEINVVCGQEQKVTVTADQNLHDLIATKVGNDTLDIGTTGSFCTSNSMIIDISIPRIGSIHADGSTEILLECSSFQGEKLSIDLQGTSSMKAVGEGKMVDIKLRDTVELDASQFKAEEVLINARDTSEAQLLVSRKLSGESRDTSEVHYSGRPQIVETQAYDIGEFISED